MDGVTMLTQEVVTLISTVGFPIVACVYLATTFKKTIDANTVAMSEMTAAFKAFWRQYEKEN